MPWCFSDEQTSESEALLDRLSHEDVFAPALWALEVINTLDVAERKGRITSATTDAFIARLRRMKVILDHDLEGRAFSEITKLTRRHKISAYDASYLELAIRLRIPLASRDEKLKSAAKNAGVALIGA